MPMFTLTPITVDGVSLDDYAWGVESKVRDVPGLESADVYVNGMHGVIASLNDDFQPGMLELGMWVRGTDEFGVVPPGSNSVREVRDNLDQLAFLFSKTYALIDVREDVAGLGVRRILCKRSTPIRPEEVVAGSVARFKVVLEIPSVFGEDVTASDWTQASAVAGNVYEVTTLAGGTAPITDAIITVTGPINTPVVTDFPTGAFVKLNANLSAGQVWRVNCGTWASQVGTLTFGSLDTAGTNQDAVTDSGGGAAPYLVLQPSLSSGARRVLLSLTGSALTSATAFGVRARRKWHL